MRVHTQGDMTCEAVSTKLAYLFGTVTPDTAYNILDSVRGGEAQITSPPASIRDSVTPTKHAARSPNPENPECQQIPGPRQAESETDQTVNSMFSNAANFIRLDVTPPPVELRELHKTTSGTLEAKGTIDLENITRLIEYLLQRNLRGEISDSAMSNSMKNMFSDLGHSFPNMDHIDH